MFVFLLSVFSVLGFSCGVPLEPASRIHGGINAPTGYAPHMAALLYGDPRVRVICGSSIISSKHLLTAAHCLDFFILDGNLSKLLHGRVGSNVWHSGGTIVQFETFHMHPEWDEDTLKYDAAVLELTEELVLSDTVAVIGLDFGWVGGDVKSYITGWGTTWPRIDDDAVHLAPTPDDLQLLYLRTMDPIKCHKAIQSDPKWAEVAPEIIAELEICTFHSVGYGLCHGDSGSALVVVETGLQTGVVSWGIPCARGAPDVYTRVQALFDFLQPILNIQLP